MDGIVEDLITEFSMIKEIDVASRKTCFEYREKNESIESFINDWDLDFVVSGSIRAVEDRIRVSVELLEVEDSRVIWSNKYDRVKTDIFEVQDEIVTKIINSIINAYKNYAKITPIPKIGLIIDYDKGKISDVSEAASEIISIGGKVMFVKGQISSSGITNGSTKTMPLSIMLQSVSINLPRLAFESNKDETYFRARLALDRKSVV